MSAPTSARSSTSSTSPDPSTTAATTTTAKPTTTRALSRKNSSLLAAADAIDYCVDKINHARGKGEDGPCEVCQPSESTSPRSRKGSKSGGAMAHAMFGVSGDV